MKKRMNRINNKKSDSHFESVFNFIKLSDSKHSQATVFIVIALIMVVAIGAAYIINKNSQTVSNEFFESADIKPQFDSIKNSIQMCIKTTASDALDLIGIQGGYYQKPKDYFDLGWAFIPYYYKKGEILIPAKEKIQSEISNYINENIKLCINNINKEDFDILYSTPKTQTAINKGQVIFNIDMSLTIKKQGNAIKFELKDSPITQTSKLYEIYEIAQYITDSHKENPDMICINCVNDMAEERGVYVDMISFQESSTLNIISENSTSETPYIFEFLNEYQASVI